MTQSDNKVRKLSAIYAKIRAGKNPDGGELHMSENEFIEAINAIRKADAEAIINLDEIEPEYEHEMKPHEAVSWQDERRRIIHRNYLRAEQRITAERIIK